MIKPTLILPALFVMGLACCRQEKEIKVYKVAKEPHPATSDPHAGIPGMAPGGASGGSSEGADPHAGLTPEQLAAAGGAMPSSPLFADAPPAHWKKLPASAFLLAKYRIEGEGGASVDVTFSTLRSAPGSLLANINRWLGQLEQKPFANEAAMKQGTRTVVSGFGDAVFVEVEGLAQGADPKSDGRLIGAIAQSGPNAWFFKLRGNAELAATERENFIRWIESVKPVEAAEVPMHGTPPGEQVAAPKETPAAPVSDGQVTWKLPEGWKVANGSSARYATLSVTAADGATGEVAITHFPGDVGGDLANVNRWRGQIGLQPIDEAALGSAVTRLAAEGKTFQVIDITGPQNRCISGWVRHGAETWFFKFTGPEGLVGAEKQKFTSFLESIRFNSPE